jgi:hypothetical protein
MNHENYIGMDVRQATISVAVLGQADDGMPAGDQGRPRFRLEASCRAANGQNESFLHPSPAPCRLPQSCNLCPGVSCRRELSSKVFT